MPPLPPNPDLEQLRHRARDLQRAAERGDVDALARLLAVADRVTLSAAQLAVAREHGFPSWPALKAAVGARTRSLADAVDAFCAESVRGRIEHARRLLDATPEVAVALPAALVLGDAARVRAVLARDPGLVARVEPRTGFTALHAVCASRWHVDPERAAGLVEAAGTLLAAGADPHVRSGQWTPLRCAIASAQAGSANMPIVMLLLDRGARVEDHDLYLAGFAADAAGLLAVLVAHLGDDVAAVAEQALAAPVSTRDEASVRLLLRAGADPNRYRDDDGEPARALVAAIAANAPTGIVEALLAHGADASAPAPDGRTPLGLATARARDDVADLLRRHGAGDGPDSLDLLRRACLRDDAETAHRLLADQPALRDRLAGSDALPHAAEAGNAAAVRLLLDLGVPPDGPRAEHGATALHVAAYAGSVDAVRLLIERGAALDARDATWQSPPLEWACIGSGERPATADAPDWVAVVALLLDAGAATDEVALSADDPKPPSAAVARLLRERLGPGVDAGGASSDDTSV